MSSVLFLENAIYYEHNELLRLIWMTFWYTVRCCFQGSALPPSLPNFPFAIVILLTDDPWYPMVTGVLNDSEPSEPSVLVLRMLILSDSNSDEIMASWEKWRLRQDEALLEDP